MSSPPPQPQVGSPSTHTASLSRRAARFSSRRLSDVSLASILAGRTCAPISLADFDSYLAFKEHSIENLHFVIWYQSYRERFFALDPSHSTSCSTAPFDFPCRSSPARTAQLILESKRKSDAVSSPPVSPTSSSFFGDSVPPSRRGSTLPMLSPTSTTFSQPSTLVLPPSNLSQYGHPAPPKAHTTHLQIECAQAAATFLRPGSPKELMLDADVRETLLRELAWNTHPDAFLLAYESALEALETISLPRFLAYASANINRPKQIFWYTVGIVDMLLAIIAVILLIVFLPEDTSEASRRAWRLAAVPLFSLGSMQTYSAWRGFCSEIWGRGGRQLRVWELRQVDVETAARWPHSPHKPTSSDARIQEKKATLSSVYEEELSMCEHSPRSSASSARSQSIPLDAYDDPEAIPDFDVALALHSVCRKCGREKGGDVRVQTVDAPSTTSPNKPPCRPPSQPPGETPLPDDLWGWEKATNDGWGTRWTRRPLEQYRRPPVFGPESPVLDPRIRAVHKAVMNDMLLAGFVSTVLFTGIVLAIPSCRGSGQGGNI
ncbi:hypothetical protein C8Q78DRAFT_1001625 [Trametes maxima]|nr:hypothetical protein C8Q78DRAFT_1001625 [Trametes maxima]